MNYKTIDKETYYRKGVFRHFSEDCKCSTSMTARIDVTDLAAFSKRTETKWGKYREESGKLVMPVTVRLNHAIADGYLVANVFRLLEREIKAFTCV